MRVKTKAKSATKSAAPAKSTRRVALAFPTRLAHLHTVVHGIIAYAKVHGDWVFTTSGEAHDLSIRRLRRWGGDGVIVGLESEADAKVARRSSIPVVTFLGSVRKPGIPRVMMDQPAIGRMAADHLIARGFRQFAFYGLRSTGYSLDRRDAFMGRLAKEEYSSSEYLSPSTFDREHFWDDEMDALCRWIKKLPMPIGIFAVNDGRARMVADACRLVGRRVPEEVGIIGVDNTQLDCEFGSPTLTSIGCDWRLVGFEVAGLLDHLMRGGKAPAADQLIPPTGVISRESTAVTIVDHPAVARAISYARDHLGNSFGVKAMVAAAGVSRRHLENSFVRSLRRTPSEFLAEIRVEKAKDLLSQTDLTLSAIADKCGFSDVRQFRRVFARSEAKSPRDFRAAKTQHKAKLNQDALGGLM